MKVILAGGSGHVGRSLARAYSARGWDVVTLGRGVELAQTFAQERYLRWDAKTLGPWVEELEGADRIVNLAGRSVNCRYTPENLALMMDSRVDSTRVMGQAIAACRNPAPLWLQMSTATIYAHRFDAPNDDEHGIIGGQEPGVPAYWQRSIAIAQAWERELEQANTPETRKVALRASMIMGDAPGSVFDTLYRMTRRGLGGSIAGGRQFMSWIHERDFERALDFIADCPSIRGPIIVAGPNPIAQKTFMRILREAAGVRLGLPATAGMVRLGAVFMRTDAELVLKSRRVHPSRLIREGFRFEFPTWPQAVADLLRAHDARTANPRELAVRSPPAH